MNVRCGDGAGDDCSSFVVPPCLPTKNDSCGNNFALLMHSSKKLSVTSGILSSFDNLNVIDASDAASADATM
jgi:hypothetical protein